MVSRGRYAAPVTFFCFFLVKLARKKQTPTRTKVPSSGPQYSGLKKTCFICTPRQLSATPRCSPLAGDLRRIVQLDAERGYTPGDTVSPNRLLHNCTPIRYTGLRLTGVASQGWSERFAVLCIARSTVW